MFYGENINDNCFEMELNEILLNSIPNIWSRQEYVQIFDCDYIAFKQLLIFLNAWKLEIMFTKVY